MSTLANLPNVIFGLSGVCFPVSSMVTPESGERYNTPFEHGKRSAAIYSCALYPDPILGQAELAVKLLEEGESDQTVDVITGRELEYVEAIVRYDEAERPK